MDHQAVYMSLAHFLKLLLLLQCLALKALLIFHTGVRLWHGLLCVGLNILCPSMLNSSCC